MSDAAGGAHASLPRSLPPTCLRQPMIPLKDRNPTRLFPLVTVALIALNILAWLFELSLGGRLDGFIQVFGLVPARLTTAWSGEGVPLFAAVPVFTSIFLHGGWLHLIGNMLYLWVFGDNVEDKLGHGRFIFFYLLCGLAASVLHVAMDPASPIPTVGASGAVSGVLGAYLLLFPRARVLTLIPIFIFLQLAELPALVVIGIWFILQFVNGMISMGMDTAGMGGVAWWAHIGGFAAGMLLVYPFRKYK